MVVLTALAFAPSYFLVPLHGQPPGERPITPLLHLHALAFTTWALLYGVQTVLVAARRTPWHRRLGVAGACVYAAMAVLGPWVVIAGVQRGATPPVLDPRSWLLVGLMNALAYIVLIGAALVRRGTPATHKRLMYVAMCGLLSAVFGRLPTMPGVIDELPGLLNHVVWPGAFIAALLWWDVRSSGRAHRVTVVAGPILLVWQGVPVFFWTAGWWLQAASAILRAVPRSAFAGTLAP